MNTLEIESVIKSYGSFQALKGIDLTIASGEFAVLVGPSGCGKSTLLRTIAGLEGVDGGAIRVAGRDITAAEPAERGVAMVFQNYALYPHMTVGDNMGFGLKMARQTPSQIGVAIERASTILGIGDHLDKHPRALSGGQKQRVAIGRAITRSPEVFLFDEPLSNLDAALRTRMRVELGRLHNELDATMVYVTHDQVEAMTMADRIVVLSDGQIEQVGAPLELYNRPLNRFVAGFLGSPRMNIVDATVSRREGENIEVDHPALGIVPFTLDVPDRAAQAQLAPGQPVAIGFRPETFGEGSIELTVLARVVENLGRETLLYGTADNLRSSEADAMEGDIVVQLPRQQTLSHGERIQVRISPEVMTLFDENGITRSFARQN